LNIVLNKITDQYEQRAQWTALKISNGLINMTKKDLSLLGLENTKGEMRSLHIDALRS